jgi:sugar O-acyltransferase (sialic acid O-acetyltransferase NeuD family)
MKKPIILIGGGGHCKSCIDVIEQEDKYQIVGILDLPQYIGMDILGHKIIGTDEDIPELSKTVNDFLITIGQIKSSEKRISRYGIVKKYGGNLPIITSPRAYVSKSAIIEEGTIIMHDVIINADVRIGKNCIINSKALVEHESNIGDFSHISTGAILNGQTKIGNNCFIGSGSVISNNLSIISDTVIAAGVVIYRDISQPGTYFSNTKRL